MAPQTPENADAQPDSQGGPPAEPAPEVDEREIDATVEAILFSTDAPLSAAKIAQVAELRSQRTVKSAIARLNERYGQARASFRIEPIADGYQMLTLPEYHDVLRRLFTTRSESKLSQAALETLAIVAYRQPILRADVEAIRGVSSGEMIRKLLEKQLVKIVGRAEVIGRPMLYGTTRRFLEVFGLKDLSELPNVEELRPKPEPPKTETDSQELEQETEEQEQDEPEPGQAETGSGEGEEPADSQASEDPHADHAPDATEPEASGRS